MKLKSLSIILSIVLVYSLFSSVVSAKEKEETITNHYGLVITKEQYNNLLSLGFNEEQIQNMEEEEFLLNKDLKGTIVSTTTQYLKIIRPSAEEESDGKKAEVVNLDKETYFKEVSEKKEKLKKEKEGYSIAAYTHSTPTEYKRMTTTISTLTSGSKYRLTNSVVWDMMPYYRYVDVSGVGINSTYWGPIAGSEYGKQTWTEDSICYAAHQETATYTSSSDKWKRGAGGYSLKMNLPNDDLTGGCGAEDVTALSSYMYFTVSKMTTTDRIDAYGQYAHQEAEYTLSPGIDLSGISFSVSPSTKFSIHPNTHAQVFF